MYYVGVDIGGTSIKYGIVDKFGNILFQSSMLTEAVSPYIIIENLAKNVKKLCLDNGVNYSDILSIGVGCPGAINGKSGMVVYSSNLKWTDFPLKSYFEKVSEKPVRIANDADAAALGEVIFGCAKQYRNVILLTLGTGVGGGIVIDKKLYEGSSGMVAELGHIIMRNNGIPCGCGRRGCFEQYASATALIRMTKQAMKKHEDSLLWQEVNGDINLVNGKTAFDSAQKGDKTAKKVVKKYVSYLSEGILDYCNIFRPDAVILGGGISKQGKSLTDMVIKYLEKYNYGYKGTPKPAILTAKLQNSAGIIGAASLVAEEF